MTKLHKGGYRVIGIDNTTSKSVKGDILNCDVSREVPLNKILNKFKPKVIIHCAAIKNLPECEENKEKSFATNVLSTEFLCNYARKSNAKLIYISSDVVFDGSKGNYSELDQLNPINWYGKTKAFSEILVRRVPNSAICRTALVIGKLPEFYKKILKDEIESDIIVNQTLFPQYIFSRLKKGKSVVLPSTIVSNPTPVDLLCEFILKIISKDATGIFHTVGPDSVSRYQFACLISENFKFDSKKILINDKNISPLRPRNISLNSKSTFKLLGLDSENWRLKSCLSNKTLYE